ncbi:MAG: hypothetical protein V1793_25075 [Pseudomonadota bacterium]
MTTYRRIKSVELTISILKFMAQEIQPVSGNEIADALNEPHGTIMCHLVTLEDGGLVKRVYDRFEIGIYFGVLWAAIKSSRQARISESNSDLNKITIE